MTVCIAGICDGGKNILAVSDRKISTFIYSGDKMAIKMSGLTDDWAAMWASEDVTEIPPIIHAVKSILGREKCSCASVVEAFTKVFQETLTKNAANKLLSPFGIDMAQFLQDGKNMFTERQHDRLMSEIMAERIKSQFLVFGFDEDERSHIFVTSDVGQGQFQIEHHDGLGFATIGSGSTVAESSLYFHGYSTYDDIYEATYLLCQAKFMSETADGVGKETLVFAHRPKEGSFALRSEDIETIRAYWERDGKPRIPKGAYDMTKGVLLNPDPRISA